MRHRLTVEVEDPPQAADVATLNRNLIRFNQQTAGNAAYKPMLVALRDATGALVGGCYGWTSWGWLCVDLLWIDPAHRGTGYGRQLLAAAEREAVRRGCRGAYLDTFSFQAPQFYLKQGYAVFGELPDFPAGHTRYYLRKSLA